jgi:rsbT co-antagonist protein RsbR
MANEETDRFLSGWSACPDAVCALGPEGRISWSNRAFSARLGLATGASLGEPLVNLVGSDDRAKVELELALVSTSKGSTSFEATCARADGTLVFSTWTAWHSGFDAAPVLVVLRDDARLVPMSGSATQMLRAQDIVDTSPTFIVGIDASGKVVFMNGTMLGALGYTRDEVLEQDYMSMFVPGRDQAALAKVFKDLVQARGTTYNENRVLTRSGRELLVEWHGRSMVDKRGAFEYFFGVGIDVTAQKRLRDALNRSQQRLALHFQQAPFGMIEWDNEFRVVDWNPAAERIFGWTHAEALGKYGQDLVVPVPIRPYVADIWQQILEAKGAVHAYNENVTKDERTIICEWFNTALVDDEGRVVGVSSLVNDVTERHKAEEDLRKRERAQAATIEQLSAPVIDLWDGVLALPVTGAVDEARAGRMTENMLEAIVSSGARFSILDMTGATEMDAALAQHVGDMVRAASLVGSECLVSGLSPAMARALALLDVPLGVKTFGTLRAALRHAIRAARA